MDPLVFFIYLGVLRYKILGNLGLRRKTNESFIFVNYTSKTFVFIVCSAVETFEISDISQNCLFFYFPEYNIYIYIL